MKIYLYSLLGIVILFSACAGDEDSVSAYGNFEADEVLVSSEGQGKCLSLNAKQGMEVTKGDTIAVLDTLVLHLKKKQVYAQKLAVKAKFPSISAQVRVQEQEILRLMKDENRILALIKDKAATQKQLDDVQSGIEKLKRSVEQIKTQNKSLFAELEVLDANLAIIDENINKAFVVAPLSGTVLENYIEEGELLMPGRAVVKIANLESLSLRAWISGDQLSEVKIGDQVSVNIDKNGGDFYKYQGVVIWISAEAEFTPTHIQTRTERVKMVYAVKVNVKNDGRIKIGMPGEIFW